MNRVARAYCMALRKQREASMLLTRRPMQLQAHRAGRCPPTPHAVRQPGRRLRLQCKSSLSPEPEPMESINKRSAQAKGSASSPYAGSSKNPASMNTASGAGQAKQPDAAQPQQYYPFDPEAAQEVGEPFEPTVTDGGKVGLEPVYTEPEYVQQLTQQPVDTEQHLEGVRKQDVEAQPDDRKA